MDTKRTRRAIVSAVSRRRQGFTLIEIMVVVVIIGMLAALIGPRVMGSADEARVNSTKTQIDNIVVALDLFRLNNGFYPTTNQGLAALIQKPTIPPEPRNYQEGGYLRSLPKDAWGNDFVYLCPGNNGREFEVISYGRDGQEGGTGLDADIINN